MGLVVGRGRGEEFPCSSCYGVVSNHAWPLGSFGLILACWVEVAEHSFPVYRC